MTTHTQRKEKNYNQEENTYVIYVHKYYRQVLQDLYHVVFNEADETIE